VTVSEDGARPRFSADEERRAALGDEAWDLQNQGKGLRTIRDIFRARGIAISHATVAELIHEAVTRAKFLDFVGPATSRAASIGRLDAALERQLKTIAAHAAALETGELQASGKGRGKVLEYDQAASVLDKAVARYVQLESLFIKVTGAAMPTRHQIEDSEGNPVTPNMAVLAETVRTVAEHAKKTKQLEETDGLDG